MQALTHTQRWDKVRSALSELLHELPAFPGVQGGAPGYSRDINPSHRSAARGSGQAAEGSRDPAVFCAPDTPATDAFLRSPKQPDSSQVGEGKEQNLCKLLQHSAKTVTQR